MATTLDLPWSEVLRRIGAETVCAAVIGVNRYLHRKPAGLETFSVVALDSATIMIVMQAWGDWVDPTAVGHTVQWVVTGIGFLGAGLILRVDSVHKVSGLTTAAAVWLAAVLGITCGLGLQRLAALVLAATFVILVIGHPIEHWFREKLQPRPPP